MLASEVIDAAVLELKDPGYVRWSLDDHYKFILGGQREIILLRPDANALTESLELSANATRQSIPTGGLRLLDVVRNMGSDGLTPGAPITLVDRDTLDDANSAWHTEAGSSEIDHFTFDDRNPTVYYVTPPPAASVYAEVVYAGAPAVVTTTTDTLSISDNFFEALLSYHLYRAFRVNFQSAEDWGKSREHLRDFYLTLGEEAKAKAVYSPNTVAEVVNNA